MDVGIGMGSAHTVMGAEDAMLYYLHTRKPEKPLLSFTSSLCSAATALRRPSAYETHTHWKRLLVYIVGQLQI